MLRFLWQLASKTFPSEYVSKKATIDTTLAIIKDFISPRQNVALVALTNILNHLPFVFRARRIFQYVAICRGDISFPHPGFSLVKLLLQKSKARRNSLRVGVLFFQGVWRWPHKRDSTRDRKGGGPKSLKVRPSYQPTGLYCTFVIY